MIAIFDTTILVHLIRKNTVAQIWFNQNREGVFGISSITWMEVMCGVPNKSAQVDTLALLSDFQTLYLTQSDQEWAQKQIVQLRFSHGIGINDALIASVSHRLQIPLYTHNLKHMQPMIGNLAIKPY